MANVLTTGALLSAPKTKPSFFARLLRAQIEFRQRQADRLVEQYLVVHGSKFTDENRAPVVCIGQAAMILALIVHAIKLARFGKGAWRETHRRRRTLPGPNED